MCGCDPDAPGSTAATMWGGKFSGPPHLAGYSVTYHYTVIVPHPCLMLSAHLPRIAGDTGQSVWHDQYISIKGFRKSIDSEVRIAYDLVGFMEVNMNLIIDMLEILL